MSALPLEIQRQSPRSTPSQPRRLDVAPTREQKRARPKSFYALVTVAGLFAILIAQLLLSIVVSDGAYQISALQQEQKELSRDQQSLTEQLNVLESPQHLAANAEQLGMITNSSTAYLRLSDGAVLGNPAAASSAGATLQGADGGPLIANQLLTAVSLAVVTPVSSNTPTSNAPTSNTPSSGAPQSTKTPPSIASDSSVLPSPTTR